MRPLVLKIGGSLAETGRLRKTLDIAGRAKRRVVVVPGGGPFAEAVRKAQAAEGFSDATAHRMAILAMHQMAELMVELQPRLQPAETLAGIQAVWTAGRLAVWLPFALAVRDTSLPCDWTITSDGLAARLAERLRGLPVALVKSRRVAPGTTPAALARQGIADPVFAAIVVRAGLEWHVLGPGDEDRLAGLLAADGTKPPRSPKR